MSAIADSRKLVLERIGAARRNSAATAENDAKLQREYVRRGALTAGACAELFLERLREYDAEVVACAPEGLVAAIAAQLRASGRRRFVVPPGLPAEWMAEGFDWKIDDGMTASEVEQCEGVVTECFCGVAESGTIVLHHGPMEGRRVITLLPDWHLCVVRARQVVETLPEYFDRCAKRGQRSENGDQGAGKLPALVTWISGPSATADIEMTRIKGVHGPRFLNVILVRD
jgi:L-lactate dehydrogenase complex protein LldG